MNEENKPPIDENDNPIDELELQKLDKAVKRSILHIDPDTKYFAVSEGELNKLHSSKDSSDKEIWIACLSLGTPFIVNAFILLTKIEIPQEGSLAIPLDLFINFLFGLLGIIIGTIFYARWRKLKKNEKSTLEEILKKKPYEIT